MFKEFKKFLMKGNLVEIAVAFVMGAAFSRVVSTFTARVVSPAIAKVFNLPDLDSLWTFGEEADGVPAGSFGALLAASLDFVIVALVMFMVVKAYNRTQAQEESEAEEDPGPSEDIVLLTEIRDALRK